MIDDCSTDGSDEIMKILSERDSRIKCYFNSENRGVSYTRNLGMDKATGKYICFLDADDYLENGSLEKYFRCMEDANAQGCFIRFCDNENGNIGIANDYEGIFSGRSLLGMFAANNEEFLFACGAMWNTSFIKDNGIKFRNLKIGEGGLFILQAMLSADRICVSDYKGYHYEINDTSVNKNKNAMSYASLGQTLQISYLLLNLENTTGDKSLTDFLKWYIKKNAGGIRNLGLEFWNENAGDFSDTEKFLTELIRGEYSGKKVTLSQNDEEMLKQSGRIYIYGAGYETEQVLSYCNNLEICVLKIFVTSKDNNPDNIWGHHIYEFSEKEIEDKNIPVLITTHKKHCLQIRNTLDKAGIKNIVEL